MYCVFRAHQTRRSGRNSRPISAEVALFLFASHSFLANYLRFMVKLIDKAIVINVKIHKNERKGFYSSNKEGLICLCKSWKESRQTSVNLHWRNSRWKLNPKSKNIQTRFLYQIGCWIVLYFNYFNKNLHVCIWLIFNFECKFYKISKILLVIILSQNLN